MAFFQNSVINKYIQTLDKQTLQNAYAKFRAHFHNATIQENIRGSKEEQYQGEFLIDLFVNVLGYTKNPAPNFNLTTEYKNVKDSKKADGAIIINEIVKAVIELKGTNTTDLNKIEVQAFGYKNNQPECEYVITSNFEKIRFYIDNAIEYTEFNLFTLTEKEFELLYICLSYDSIAKGLPKQIKDESVSQESLITKKLYNDYSQFKNELYHSLVKLNPQYEPLELFKKSQKLLDRFLFIFFAEDRQLLPTNLIFRINKEWQQLRNMRIEVSLYDRYKIYFNDLDQGAKVSLPAFSQTASKQVEEFQIYAYNGGLFKTDDLLNDIKIEDELLFAHTEKLSNYDFASEVDVNVLGHIFENSLNDLDEIKAQLEGQEVDKTKTKRKKDGVFYTPKYITKYIVDNTVGKLCLEKKEALQLSESDYTIDKKRQKKTTQELTDKLSEYRNWLLQLTICDPACGSGAFLNQALDFLITEHRYVDELQAKLFGDALVLSDVEGSILENNLFGVDINEESVEIAKLSLWLRTAQPNRKLNDLNGNIKCGNSLIDDIAVAGNKAFNWNNSFKEVFEKGGFDVIIGNPPYVRQELIVDVKPFLQLTYKCFNGTADLYTYFFEKGLLLLKSNGLLGYIAPNKFINSNYGINLRKFLSTYQINKILDFGELPVFSDASTFPAIYIIEENNHYTVTKYAKINSLIFTELDFELKKNNLEINIENEEWKFHKDVDSFLLNKLCINSINLSEYVGGEIKFGLKTGFNEAYIIDEKIKDELILEDKKNSEIIYPFIDGDNVRKYKNEFQKKYIIAAKMGLDLEDYPSIITHFNKYKVQLEKRSDKGNKWYQLRACSYYRFFEEPKILYPDIALEPRFSFDDTGIYPNATLFVIPKSDKYLLAILNSKVAWFYFSRNCPVIGDINKRGRLRLKTAYISKLPIKNIDLASKKIFSDKSDLMLFLNKELQSSVSKFKGSLERKFNLDSLPKKIEDWYSLSYSEFIKELAKKKIKLSLSDEAEWEEYFITESKKALELKSKIDTTDKEIDQMVYKLYDLTEEEIKIVEGL